MASPDNTMPRRRSQAESERDPNADITDAIAALPDPERRLAMAIIDRVQAIVGNQQLRSLDAFDDLRLSLDGYAHQVGAVIAKQDLITEHLQRQDPKLDKIGALTEKVENVRTGLTVLASEFRSLGETLNERITELDERHYTELLAVVRRVEDNERRLDQKRKEIDELKAEVFSLKTQLAARPTAEQAHATYKAMRWLVEQRGGDPDALGLPKVE